MHRNARLLRFREKMFTHSLFTPFLSPSIFGFLMFLLGFICSLAIYLANIHDIQGFPNVNIIILDQVKDLLTLKCTGPIIINHTLVTGMPVWPDHSVPISLCM
jgi:hypothetical protein